jgi:hypothetical protein
MNEKMLFTKAVNTLRLSDQEEDRLFENPESLEISIQLGGHDVSFADLVQAMFVGFDEIVDGAAKDMLDGLVLRIKDKVDDVVEQLHNMVDWKID